MSGAGIFHAQDAFEPGPATDARDQAVSDALSSIHTATGRPARDAEGREEQLRVIQRLVNKVMTEGVQR